MDIIIGTGKIVKMKKIALLLVISVQILSCHNQPADNANTAPPGAAPKTNISITHVNRGAVNDNIELFATTLYLKRNLVTAPIPAFITKVNVRLGDKVNKGDVLYVLESKERRALGDGSSGIDSSLTGFGIISVKAPASGIISTFDKQQTGDYVLEGALLCTIAASNDLAFQLNVPFEFIRFIRTGKNCSILLPDSSVLIAKITTPLTAMNMTAQTQSVLAQPAIPHFLPENLIAKVFIRKNADDDRQVLPKTCVQSDEMMRSFWIMKLLNDSMAVKVPVTIGNKNITSVEILNPVFSLNDRIVEKGSYGLNDTALVKITL
jgi:hypothetical protein